MTSDRREPSDDQIDAVIERMAREENDELARAWGQHILDATAFPHAKRGANEDPLLEVLRRAHQTKAGEE